MKKIILSLILLVGWSQLFSQTHTSAFFVYRNDMPVTPFFFENVDSIRQSRIDLDSIECPEFVVTEFWTPDSVHRVPIAVIDSIAFTTPSEIRKPGSVEITDEQFGYLLEVDSLTLKFSPSIPQQLIPKKGEKLTYLNVNRILPNGFLGLVRDVVSSEEGVIVNCDSIGISDAFDRLYQVGEYVSYPRERYRNNAHAVSRNLKYFEIEPIEIPFQVSEFKEFSKSVGNFDFGLGNEIKGELTYYPAGKYVITLDIGSPYRYFYLDFYGPATHSISGELNAFVACDMTLGWGEKLKMIVPLSPEIPIFLVLYPEITLTGSIGSAGTIKRTIDIGYEIQVSDDPNYKNYAKLKKIKEHNPIVDFDLLSANATLYAGAFLGVRLGFPKLKFERGFSFGSQYGYNFRIGVKDFELARDNKLTYDKFFTDATYKRNLILSKVSKGELANFKFSEGTNVKFNEKESKILPKFTCPKYIELKSETYLEYEMCDETFTPISLGIKVEDKDKNIIYKQYEEGTYKNGSTILRFPYLHKTFNKKCTVYPMFKIFGREITASPSYELYFKATPVTDQSISRPNGAKLNGHIEMDSQTLLNIVSTDYKVGFRYSTSSSNVYDGNEVICELQSDKTFTADISGLKSNTDYYYCALVTVNGETEYGETKHFSTTESEEVDLGLSVNWRAWNVGAEHAHEYGNHYAWGEISTKNNYSWDSYFDNPYTQGDVWKGCDLNSDISGSMAYDPSRYLEDNGWRMPTKEEMQELLDRCKWEWTTVEDVNGYNVTGPNGNSIFLPANGLADNNSITNEGTYGAYWTSTPQSDAEGKATAATLYFYGGMLKSLQWANRYGGRAVRPVKDR